MPKKSLVIVFYMHLCILVPIAHKVVSGCHVFFKVAIKTKKKHQHLTYQLNKVHTEPNKVPASHLLKNTQRVNLITRMISPCVKKGRDWPVIWQRKMEETRRRDAASARTL